MSVVLGPVSMVMRTLYLTIIPPSTILLRIITTLILHGPPQRDVVDYRDEMVAFELLHRGKLLNSHFMKLLAILPRFIVSRSSRAS